MLIELTPGSKGLFYCASLKAGVNEDSIAKVLSLLKL